MEQGSLAILIFAAVYVAMVFDLVDRTVAVLFGALTMVGLGILSEKEVIQYIHWEALGLIFGMFVLVAALKESGFFRWIGLLALQATKFQTLKVFIIFCGLSAFLAAFMDSITVMVFMASLTIEVCTILRVPPIPFLIAEICSANIGGSATMVGDPPNVIIGTALNLTFSDFASNTGPIAMIAFAVNILVFGLIYEKLLNRKHHDVKDIMEEHKDLDPFSAIEDLRLMRIALIVFIFTVTLLTLHSAIDMFVAYAAILGATLVLFLGGRKMDHLIDKIDWHTIVFLGGLFVMVGGLDSSGVLSSFAHSLVGFTGDSVVLVILVVLWISALLSALLDNVALSAAMIPVIQTISADTGIPLNSLAYTLALGCDVGGNATPIGASANVVGLAVAEKHGIKFTWAQYCKVAIPATIVTMIVTNVLIFVLII
ncbi:MAG: ArsB/NhaD family transporter [Thermoplasmatota archaeon]|nr:ArsB/NhaD family transporter [Candidatus Thermoplasmatota archaeon]MBU1914798.1 ArsB/NhaD family transporter [Candidatus Thermoplasmatota archaeon]